MSSVIKLTKGDVVDFARTTVLANTPLSLFKGMVRSLGMDKLRKIPVDDLIEYYDQLTARAGRSEIVVGLAYAILSAIVLRTRDVAGIQVDPSRLYWGEQIWGLAARGIISTELIVPPLATQKPVVTVLNSSSAETRLFGPDGRPFPGNQV